MKPFGNRRKVYMINPHFQYSFIIFASVIGFISLCIFYFAILYFFWSFEKRGIALGIPANHIFFRFIDEERSTMNLIFVIASVLVLLTTSIGALMLSHRVAGPIYHLKKHLIQIASDKKLKPLKFRNGDFFLELEETFNIFIKSVSVENVNQDENQEGKFD